MSSDPETTRIVRSWLKDGGTVPSDWVLDTVLDQLPATPQHRPAWPMRRVPVMNNIGKLLLAAAAVVVVVIVGSRMLSGSSDVAGGPLASQPSTPGSSKPPAGTGLPSGGSVTVGSYTIAFTPHHLEHGVPVAFEAPYRITFDVPAGWSSLGWGITKRDGGPPEGMWMAPWDIGTVYVDPCHREAGGTADGPLMRSDEGVAEALSDWWGVEPQFDRAPTAPIASHPEPVSFAGYDGQYVEFSVPEDVAFVTCEGGQYISYRDVAGEPRYHQGPGQREQLWIVDVDGDAGAGGVIAIGAGSFPATSPDDLAELQAIVDSVRIEAPPGQ